MSRNIKKRQRDWTAERPERNEPIGESVRAPGATSNPQRRPDRSTGRRAGIPSISPEDHEADRYRPRGDHEPYLMPWPRMPKPRMPELEPPTGGHEPWPRPRPRMPKPRMPELEPPRDDQPSIPWPTPEPPRVKALMDAFQRSAQPIQRKVTRQRRPSDAMRGY